MSLGDDPQRVAEILAERAQRLAARLDTAPRQLLARVVTVRAGGQAFGVPIAALEEVLPLRPVARLPGLPAQLAGLVHVRGELVCVIDLTRWFAVPNPGAPRFLALLSSQGRRLALLADEVVGTRDVFADELARGVESGGRPLLGVTQDLQLLLDADHLFRHPAVVHEGSP